MNLRAMAVYCKVAERGVMAQAAHELELTPAAVTKIIAELEHALGVRLINRTTRKLHLTEAGQHYYTACQGLLEQADAMHRQFSSLATQVVGRLKIAAPISFSTQLSGAIDAFLRAYPQVKLVINFDDKVVDLLDGGYDLAIRIQREMKDSTLVARRFAEFETMLLCASSWYRAHGPIRTPADLKSHPCLAYSNAKTPSRWVMTSRKGRFTHAFQPQIETNNSPFIKQLALAGHGICVMPSFLAEDELASGALVRVLPTYSLGKATGWIVYPGRKLNSPVAARFGEFIHDWYAGAARTRAARIKPA